MPKLPKITPLAEQPTYAAAVARQNNMSAALVKVEGRIHEIDLQMRAHVSTEEHDQGHIDGALEFANSGVVKRPARPSDLAEEHLVLREQADALRKVLNRQGNEIYQIAQELSHVASAAIRSQHDELCARYVAKLRELDALHGEEWDMQVALHKLGYSDAPLPRYVQWLALGRIEDASSAIAMRIREFTDPQ
jgi:hypothetical protein